MHLLKSTEARRQCCLTQRINHQWWTFKLKEKDFFPRFFWVCRFVLFWRSVFEESSNTSISLTNHCPCYKLAGGGGESMEDPGKCSVSWTSHLHSQLLPLLCPSGRCGSGAATVSNGAAHPADTKWAETWVRNVLVRLQPPSHSC